MAGFPDSEMHGIRWMPFHNSSGEKVPPFALMMLRGYGEDSMGFGIEDFDNVGTWFLTKPNEAMEIDQNSACLFINGEREVAEDGDGYCTRDWPVRVMHNGSEDALSPGIPCGPKADDWNVWSTGDAFTCMGHVRSDKIGSATIGPQHTVMITNERTPLPGVWGAFDVAGNDVAAGEPFTVGKRALASAFTTADLATINPDDAGLVIEEKSIKFQRDVRRIVAAFYGTLTAASSVDRGTALRVTLSHKRGGSSLTSWTAGREQDIEKACEGDRTDAVDLHTTKESVAIIGHFAHVSKDDTIEITNGGGVAVTLTQSGLQIFTVDRSRFRKPKNQTIQ